jgi:hypothetical protein
LAAKKTFDGATTVSLSQNLIIEPKFKLKKLEVTMSCNTQYKMYVVSEHCIFNLPASLLDQKAKGVCVKKSVDWVSNTNQC